MKGLWMSLLTEKFILLVLGGSLFVYLSDPSVEKSAELRSPTLVKAAVSKNSPAAPMSYATADHLSEVKSDNEEPRIDKFSSPSTSNANQEKESAPSQPVQQPIQPPASSEAKPQKKTKEELRKLYRTIEASPIGTFKTDLGIHNESNRVLNISLSMAAVQKTVLFPGETFSFTMATGDTTNGKLGYKPAAVVIGNEYAVDFGGGICQISSTLYNAAVRAKMQIIERHSHTLPVNYVPLGKDATVNYPDLDFKFRNQLQFPVRIEVSLQGKQVVCTILKIETNEE